MYPENHPTGSVVVVVVAAAGVAENHGQRRPVEWLGVRGVAMRGEGQEESPVGNAVGSVAGIVVRIERCVANRRNVGFRGDRRIYR